MKLWPETRIVTRLHARGSLSDDHQVESEVEFGCCAANNEQRLYAVNSVAWLRLPTMHAQPIHLRSGPGVARFILASQALSLLTGSADHERRRAQYIGALGNY